MKIYIGCAGPDGSMILTGDLAQLSSRDLRDEIRRIALLGWSKEFRKETEDSLRETIAEEEGITIEEVGNVNLDIPPFSEDDVLIRLDIMDNGPFIDNIGDFDLYEYKMPVQVLPPDPNNPQHNWGQGFIGSYQSETVFGSFWALVADDDGFVHTVPFSHIRDL